MRRIYLTALAIAIRPGAALAASQCLAGLDPCRAVLSQGALDGVVPPRDRRVLDDDDLLAVEAGAAAMRAAGAAPGEDVGCIVFTTGKGTPAAERSQQRTRYRNADGGPDMRRFMQALELGEQAVDPFTLLRDLDNGLAWWLCKTYSVSGFNLQINQTQAPDYFALLEALEGLDDGLCRQALVGGIRTASREAVAMACRNREERAPPDAAAFFVLEAAEAAPTGALARLELAASPPGEECGEGTLDFSFALASALARLDQGPVRLASSGRPWAIELQRAT